jgi:hypothetical protein
VQGRHPDPRNSNSHARPSSVAEPRTAGAPASLSFPAARPHRPADALLPGATDLDRPRASRAAAGTPAPSRGPSDSAGGLRLLKPCSPQVGEEQQPTSGAAVRGEDRHVAIEDDVARDRVRSGSRQVPKWLGGRSPIPGFGGGRHPIGWSSKTRRPSAASTGWSRSTPSTMRMNQTPSGTPRA